MSFRTLFDTLKPERSRSPTQQLQRSSHRRRPTDRQLVIEALEGRSMLSTVSIAVSDATLVEGNTGVKYAEAFVSLFAPQKHAVTVKYNTAHGDALAGGDYWAVSGKLTFASGQTSKSIRVPVIGDRLVESDETFFIKLHDATGAKTVDSRGVVTIMDDEPRIGINDVAAVEGNANSTLFSFVATLSAAYDQAVTVNFATANYSAATANNDYVAKMDVLTFAAGETSKTITIEVHGDTSPEPDEIFFVNLSGASNNAVIANGQGFGTIRDDDGWIAPPPEPEPVYDNSIYDSWYGSYYSY